MKTIFTTTLILISFLTYSQDRRTDVGIKLGSNYSIPNKGFQNTYGNGQVRFHGGFFSREDKGKLNILFEAFYKNTSYKSVTVHSFNFPILLETNNYELFGLHAGLSPGLTLSTKQKRAVENPRQIGTFNIDLAAGLEIKVTDKLGINTRFTYPMISQNKLSASTIMLSVHYTIKSFD